MSGCEEAAPHHKPHAEPVEACATRTSSVQPILRRAQDEDVCEAGEEPRVIVRRATAADLREYYGGDPPATVKAFAALLDGKVMGVMGIAYGGLARARPCPEVFSESRPEFARHRKSFAVLRAVKELMAMVARTRPAPIAIADRNYPQSTELLQRLGAVRIGSCEQGEVYQWGN